MFFNQAGGRNTKNAVGIDPHLHLDLLVATLGGGLHLAHHEVADVLIGEGHRTAVLPGHLERVLLKKVSILEKGTAWKAGNTSISPGPFSSTPPWLSQTNLMGKGWMSV